MRRFLLVLMLTILLAGCGHVKAYPPFPLPNEHVTQVLDSLSEKDSQVREWLNRLLDLCEMLRTCEEVK